MDVPCLVQQREKTIVFFALGSLGDSLPLCALAARLPSYVSAHCSRPPSSGGDKLERSVGGDSVGCSDVGDSSKRRRKETGVRAGSRPSVTAEVVAGAGADAAAASTKEGRGTVTFERVECVVVTHRCHCEMLRGEL